MKIVKNNNQNLTRTTSELISIVFFGLGLGIMITGSFLVAISMYLKYFSYQDLPTILLVSGAVGIVLSLVYNYLHKRFSISLVATFFLLIVAIFYFYIYFQYSFSPDKEKYVMFSLVALFPTISVLFALYNAFNHSLFNISENKRLAPVAILGVLAAALLLSSAFPFILSETDFSPSNLYLLVAATAVISIIMVWLVGIQFQTIGEVQINAQYINYHNKISKLLKNKYFLRLSIFTICFTVTLWLIDVLFLYAVEQAGQITDSHELIGWSTSSLCVLAYLFLWFSLKKTVRQYGIKISLLVLPLFSILFVLASFIIGYFYGFEMGSKSFIRFFIVIVAGTVLIKALKFGLQNSLFRLYFSPIESNLRYDIQNTTEGMIRYITTFITGLILLGITELGTSTWVQSQLTKVEQPYFPVLITFCIILFSVGWIASIISMYKMYKGLLEDHLGQQRNLIKHDQSLTKSFLFQLQESISESSFERAVYRLNMLKVLDPVIYRRVIVELTDHQNEHIQELAVSEISNYHLLDALPSIQKVMSWRYFPALKTAGLVRKVNIKLNEALTRIEQVKYVDQLTSSKLLNERNYGALLAQHLAPEEKGQVLNKLFGDTNQEVIYNAIVAAAGADDPSLHNNLIPNLKNPEYSNATVSAISASDDSITKMLETAFQLSKQDQRTQQRILQIYGRISTENAVTLLLNKLNYPNQNVVATCLDALSRCGFTVTDSSKSLQVRTELEEVCNAMVWNMAVYIDAETNNCSSLLLRALEYEIATNYETVFRLLALIYDPKSVELVKININSNNVEESEFASDLLDIFINDEMKSFLIPIFKISSYQVKVEELMNIFPTESMKKAEMLVNLVQRDYKWINSWTKTCALKDLSKLTDFNSLEIMASHLVNPDPMLRETAAQALHESFPDAFDKLATRYQRQAEFNFAYETTEVIRGIDQNIKFTSLPVLKFDIINFLNEIEEFSSISGLVLSELVKRTSLHQYKEGEVIATNKEADLDYYFIYKGEVVLRTNVKSYPFSEKQMIHTFNLSDYDHSHKEIKAVTAVSLMKIDSAVFHELLSFYEEIPKSMLKHFENEKSTADSEMALV